MIGERIGTYTIVEKLGEGGMGVVYRATDSRLHRDVALKFIPEAMAKDPQIMGRFEREAQVLASLNHPNIAAIYGLEENGGQRALVMELASGEELATRITRGKLPLEEALRIALAIADALEAAHDKGIIHRDLKPANIKLGSPGDSGGGRLKILDFGLAKALQGDLGSGSSGVDLTRSPTLSVAATQAGMILGTASYMSPEQARALPADRRADIWSFGVVLFEMLAGQRAFRGDTVADTVAKVIEREPDWSALPASTPPKVRELIERCLVKNPRQRLQAIGDARLVLEESLATLQQRPLSVDAPALAAPAPVTIESSRVGFWRSLAAVLGVIAVAALAWAAASALRPAPQATVESPLTVEMVVGRELFNELGTSFVLTPDGRTLAYIESGASERELFVRRLDELQATQIAIDDTRSTGPLHPFISPDGKWIGFAVTNELRKVPVTGGSPLVVSKVTRSRGATWLADDTIVFAPNPGSGLLRVPAAGGEPQPLTTLDEKRGEITHRWPQAFPDGEHVLFTSLAGRPNYDSAALEVVSIATGERKVVYRGGTYGRYAPTGHLLFVNRGTLFAIPFDLDSLETRGAAVAVLQKVATSPTEGGAQYDFSATGRLVYATQTTAVYPISRVDRDGRATPLLAEPQLYVNPRLSPDGTRLALTELRDGNWDIWIHDLERGVSTRVTFEEGVETEQIWSPDGEHLVFSSDRDGPDSLFRKRADGSGETERLTEAKFGHFATSWSRDGRYIAYMDSQSQYDLLILDLETRETMPFLSTQFGESFGAISPNGRFLAYSSNESGVDMVYVRPFPSGEGKWQVSDGSGAMPRWRADGRELFWRNDEGIVAAGVETDGATFRAGKAAQLFSGPWRGGVLGIPAWGLTFADYDVTPDGQSFVMFPDTESGTKGDHQHLTLVTRFFDQLKTIEGAAK